MITDKSHHRGGAFYDGLTFDGEFDVRTNHSVAVRSFVPKYEVQYARTMVLNSLVIEKTKMSDGYSIFTSFHSFPIPIKLCRTLLELLTP